MPEIVSSLTKRKEEVLVETGAGKSALATDAAYKEAGATVFPREEVLKKADFLIGIHPPDKPLVEALDQAKMWLSQYNPMWNTDLVKQFV